MKTIGIVAEYNPFHNGHKFQIERAKRELEADAVIAVMSGNFVQRGEPAIFDKWTRTNAAILNGVDLVIELPAYFSLKSAEGFAQGAVSILNSLGLVDYISFGSECGDVLGLHAVSDILINETVEFKEVLNENLKKGFSFAKARELTIESINKDLSYILKEPNNILGVEYLKALRLLDSQIKPHTIKRSDTGYHSLETKGEFASATLIRAMLINGEDASLFMPYIPSQSPITIKSLEQIILYSLIGITKEKLDEIPDTGDGLLERVLSAKSNSLDGLLKEIKTRRLALARIKRVLMNILISNSLPKDLKPSYIRVLGFNKVGASVLKKAKKTALLPIITKPAAYKTADLIWNLENRATDILSLIAGKPLGQNITTSPVMLQNDF